MRESWDFIIEFPDIGRSYADGGPEVDILDLQYWEEAVSALKKREFTYQGFNIILETDWRPKSRQVRRDFPKNIEWHEILRTGVGLDFHLSTYKRRRRTKVPGKIIIIGKKGKTDRALSFKGVAESFLYDVFLIMNLAMPGSCNFFHGKLRFHKDVYPRELLASSAEFENALLDSKKEKCLALKSLSLDEVVKWVFAIRNGASQVPQNRAEKFLFAILHISKMDFSPATVIWLFYALETLFDTKVGENFRILVERIRLLHSIDDEHVKLLRTNLRAMYDFRSSFVHGGLEIIHPMHDETIDDVVNEKYDRIMDVSRFGIRLLLSSVQAVIEKGWRWPEFTEVLCGAPTKS